MVLQEPKKCPDHVYFIESGLVSLRLVAEGSILETALIGHRGAVGASPLMEGHLSTHQAVVLVSETAHRIRFEDLHRLMNERPAFGSIFSVRSSTDLALPSNGIMRDPARSRKRLASSLCFASDAFGAHVLPVTHDYISSALGLRRAGVTQTLIRFEEQGLIRKTRGVLQIDDRRCLEQRTCCCCKLISAAYESVRPTRDPAGKQTRPAIPNENDL
ncbi:CRP-like cAMP-binding protein [Bradyrhizobium macuxiense]|uniref:CRP-like cAMP-binding protein n=1 Tax=Bradyrhizobium macuxiense TaxID=1755647 RepID=A0A560L266_9BRAD|nr:Crp/Fnr family transcriptional regulator [Bradyrhizobium macuxiense]TWB87220.1 CRP-like cAMP-binding protein [Bradyrhizobium macuxiense]